MSESVYWLLELSIKPGALPGFADLMTEMVGATQANEPGMLIYDWTLGDEGRCCHILEWYVDCAAVMTHLRTFDEQYAGRFMKLVEPKRIVLYGKPDPAVKEALADLGPVYMEPFGGFARQSAGR
jgi:quinol monooxygenase YgiN